MRMKKVYCYIGQKLLGKAYGMNRKRHVTQRYTLLLIDLIATAGAFLFAILFRYKKFNWIMDRELHMFVFLCFLAFCIIYHVFFNKGTYFVERGMIVEFGETVKFASLMILVVLGGLFVLQWTGDVSRLVVGYFYVAFIILGWILRSIAKRMLRARFKSKSQIINLFVIADDAVLDKTIRQLKDHMDVGYSMVGAACVDQNRIEEVTSGISILADGANVLDVIRQMPLDEVFINVPSMGRDEIRTLIYELETMGLTCHHNIQFISEGNNNVHAERFADYTVATYSINHFSYRWLAVKRLMDITGGLVGLVITGIVTPFIALAIKIDSPGPIFFAQTRIGKNGRRFKIYKFRSMFIDAEERKKELEAQNEMNGLMFKMENDPRITKVGKFIRKTSLDELPQFFNIVKGDMSLVGTRPPTEDEFERYNSHYRRRISMTPGLTGMWQVSGRSEIHDFEDVVRYDLEYIDNWSLLLDLKILLQTIGVVLTRRGSK